METIFGSYLIAPTGNIATTTVNPIKFKLLLCAASWCPPCRGFIPTLIEFYQNVNQSEKQLEIIWLSRDRNEEEFKGMKANMPWLVVPFNPQATQKLLDRYEIQGLPKLLLLDEGGVAIYEDCRNDIIQKGPACIADWERILD